MFCKQYWKTVTEDDMCQYCSVHSSEHGPCPHKAVTVLEKDYQGFDTMLDVADDFEKAMAGSSRIPGQYNGTVKVLIYYIEDEQ